MRVQPQSGFDIPNAVLAAAEVLFNRLLKKSLRFRKKGAGREIFRLGWVHPEE
jgi:hypothetical protein